MRQELAQVYSDYWQHLRMDDVDIGSEPTVACRQYLDYVNKHTQRYREELRRAGPNIIFDLHQKEGPLEHQLRWHKKCVQSYEFHRQCADIQGAECRRQTREVQKGSCIIWLDWKQNISLPIQHTETGDSFWAQARAECSVLGIIVYTAAEKGKEPRKRCFVYVSDIIDHTCLAAAIQLDLARTDELADFKGISNIAVWADCGPHYRCIDFLGHLAQSWVMPRKGSRINLSVNYHAEKHGKGDVDALFAVVNSWVERAKRGPNCNIKTVEALVTHLQLDSRHLYNLSLRPKTCSFLIGQVWREDPRESC